MVPLVMQYTCTKWYTVHVYGTPIQHYLKNETSNDLKYKRTYRWYHTIAWYGTRVPWYVLFEIMLYLYVHVYQLVRTLVRTMVHVYKYNIISKTT